MNHHGILVYQFVSTLQKYDFLFKPPNVFAFFLKKMPSGKPEGIVAGGKTQTLGRTRGNGGAVIHEDEGL